MSGLGTGEIGRLLARAAPTPLDIEGFRRAAVLVPLLDAPEGPGLLLTVRAAGLRSHAGQIAFPGGRLEPDEDAVEAALRETLEEVGLVVRPEAVIGRLDDQPSPFGFVATPVVASVPWPQELRPNPYEVAETFVVPLAELRAVVPVSEVRHAWGAPRRLYHYGWRGRDIWGFTGNVVKNLLDALDQGQAHPDASGPAHPDATRQAHPDASGPAHLDARSDADGDAGGDAAGGRCGERDADGQARGATTADSEADGDGNLVG